MSSVWKLETPREDEAIDLLGLLIQEAMDTQDPKLIAYLRSLWDGESWESIQEKVNTEGSVWYVWQMDGVRAYMNNPFKDTP